MQAKKELTKLTDGEKDPDRLKILQGMKKTYNSVPVSLTLSCLLR
jgi:hypothetical protein